MLADDVNGQSSGRLKPTGCCGDHLLIDASKMELPFDLQTSIQDANLWFSMLTIMFNPLFWNVVARWEYRNHTLTKVLGSPQRGCIFLGSTIFSLGLFRDYRFNVALDSQPKWPVLYENWILLLGYGCILFGMTLVLTSYWALGFYGTFLGDYFGILMDRRVTEFPFNIFNDPMYVGSAFSFLGTSLIKASQTGIFLTIFVVICYRIATYFEGPFTAYIYTQKNKKT